MRPYQTLLLIFLCIPISIGAIYLHGHSANTRWEKQAMELRQITKVLGTGHLIFSTEAPYLRHFGYGPPFAALNTVLSGFDLFPGGSFFLPQNYYLSNSFSDRKISQ